MGEDLSEFVEMTKRNAPWSERWERMQERFPSKRGEFDWVKAFDHDPHLFGRTLQDVVRLEVAPAGRPGPRPKVQPAQVRQAFYQMAGRDFCTLPFPEAFQLLTRGNSRRAVARKVQLPLVQVHRLLAGDLAPDHHYMTSIAEAYGKHPSFFLEWRTAYIVNALANKLAGLPERSIELYRQLAIEAHDVKNGVAR